MIPFDLAELKKVNNKIMATIKIYEASGGSSNLEFGNAGENGPDEMIITITHDGSKQELYFNISKDDAKEVIAYLRKEFRL